MTRKEHIAHHWRLHRHLDELVADFIKHTGKLPGMTILLELMEWSQKQTIDPDEVGE